MIRPPLSGRQAEEEGHQEDGQQRGRNDAAQHAGAHGALLDKYAPEKSGLLKPLPEAEASELLDETKLPQDIALAQKIMELEEHIRRNGAEVLREQTQLDTGFTCWTGK